MLSTTTARAIRLIAAVLALSTSAWAASNWYVAVNGNDANDGTANNAAHAWLTPNHVVDVFGTTVNCGDTVNFDYSHGSYFLPTLQSGVPWSIGVNGHQAINCPANNPLTFQVVGGNGVCTTATPTQCAIIIGAINIGHDGMWSRAGAKWNCPDDGTTCNLWVHPLASASTKFFEQLFYNNGGGTIRRYRPTTGFRNAITTVNDPNVCFSGATLAAANVAMGCPSGGINGLQCAVQSAPTCSGSTPWLDYHRLYYKIQSGVPNINCSWHDINLGDIEIMPIESFTAERMRLTGSGCGSVSSTAGVAFLTGPMYNAANLAGLLPGNPYYVRNVAELLGVGRWYLDRCPVTSNCSTPDATWNLYIAADPATEDPTVDDVLIPQMDSGTPQVLDVENSSGLNFGPGLSFEFDNWIVGPFGNPEGEGMQLTDAAVKLVNTTNVNIEAVTISHTQGWGLNVIGASNTYLMQDSNVYDNAAGGVKFGQKACNLTANNPGCITGVPDSNSNVVHHITFQNNSVQYYNRIDPSGEGSGVFMGNGHDNLVTHNDIGFSFGGGIEAGSGLNIDADGGTTAFFMYNNTISYNHIWGQLNMITGDTIGVITDIGGIHSDFSNSSLSANPSFTAPTGWPYPTNRADFNNFIEYNWIDDIASDPLNTNKHGAACLYPDQGSFKLWIRYNLCTRTSQDGIFLNIPANKSPAALLYPQYVDVEQNMMNLFGALELANRGRLWFVSGNNQNSIAFLHNVVTYNSGNGIGEHPQTNTSTGIYHWAPFDFSCANPGSCPLPATALWNMDYNLYWDYAGQASPPTFYTCAASNTNCLSTGSFVRYTGVPWAQATNGTEDSHSVWGNPFYVNPNFGAGENWKPTNFPALQKIGFTYTDYTQAGRLANQIGNGGGPVFGVPAQSQGYFTNFINATTSYLPSYTAQTTYTYGDLTGSGNFILFSNAPPSPCSITILPTAANVPVLTTQQFTATTQNCTPPGAVFSVNGVIGGDSTHGTIDGTGLYTAPGTVPSPASVTVTAQASADATKQASATVTVIPACTVSLLPGNVTITTNATQQFTGSAANCGSNALNWYVNNILGGNTTIGVVTQAGLYTAPASIPSPATVTLKIASVDVPAISANASVTIGNCGVPGYLCSDSTDNVYVPNPLPPANLTGSTGVNQIGYDTSFPGNNGLNPVVRVTDATTNCGGTGHSLVVTPSGADGDLIWNTDDSIVIVTNPKTGSNCALSFNPATMQTGTVSATLNGLIAITFDRQIPTRLWAIKNSTGHAVLFRIDFTSETNLNFVSTQIIQFDGTVASPCADLQAVTAASPGPMSISADDSVLYTNLWTNSQDTAPGWVLAYYLSGANVGKCTTYRPDLATANIRDVNGNVLNSTTTNVFTIHANRMFGSGTWGNVSNGCTETPPGSHNCSDGQRKAPYSWQIGTANVFQCQPDFAHCSGHDGHGYSHWYQYTDPNWLVRSSSDNFVSNTDFLDNPAGLLQDAHLSPINGTNLTDQLPLLAGTAADGNSPFPFGFPLMNEVIAVFPDSTYASTRSWVRFTHSWTTTPSVAANCNGLLLDFRTVNAIGSVSQTGRFFAFTSDMRCSLGTDVDGNARSDVYIVGLDYLFAQGSPLPTLLPSTFTYANQIVNTTSSPQTFVLKNNGNGTLTNIVLSITGTNSGDFAISSTTCGTTLSAGLSCNVLVTFTPTATGARTAQLNMNGNQGPVNVASTLNGTGTPSGGTITLYPSSSTVELSTSQPFSAAVVGTTNTAGTWFVNNVAGGNSTVGTIDTNGNYFAPASSPGAITIKFTSTALGTSSTASVTLSGSIPAHSCSFTAGINNCTMTHDGITRTAFIYVPSGYVAGSSGAIVNFSSNDTPGSTMCGGLIAGGGSGQETRYWTVDNPAGPGYIDHLPSPQPMLICPDPLYYKTQSTNQYFQRWNGYQEDPNNFYNNASGSVQIVNPGDSDFAFQWVLLAIQQKQVNPHKIWIDGLWHNGSSMVLRFVIEHANWAAAFTEFELNPPLRNLDTTHAPFPSPVGPASMLILKGTSSSDIYKVCGSTGVNGFPGDLTPQSTMDDEITYWLPAIGSPSLSTSNKFCTGGAGSSFTGLLEKHSNAGTLGTIIQSYTLVPGTNITYCSGNWGSGCSGGPINLSCTTGTTANPCNSGLANPTYENDIIWNFFNTHPKVSVYATP